MHEATHRSRLISAASVTLIAALLIMMLAGFFSPREAFADPGASYDKAGFYEEDELYQTNDTSDRSASALSLKPVALSDEMKYFARFESGGDYDKGFSRGDDYHALGYYQFDHRYGLQNFLIACYEYDAGTFKMFAQFKDIPSADFMYYDSSTTESAIRHYDKDTGTWSYTDLGNALNEAWHAAYAAAPETFAALQDSWAYTNYYLPAENYLMSIGIDISNRSDCVKGLCWGMSNLFGSSGWKKFVGGPSSGYDWGGIYHGYEEGYVWPGCGLSNTMTDVQFVAALCNYVVDNVAVFYKAQPEYHQGWQNRYKNELNICLEYLRHSTHVNPNDWYVVSGAYAFATDNGIMGKDAPFEPNAFVSRGLLVTMLWRYSGSPAWDASANFSDVDASAYYSTAVAWASSLGIANGDGVAGTFRPNALLTRQELAALLKNYAEYRKGNLGAIDESNLDQYSDQGDVASWFKTAFAWAMQSELILPVESTSESGETSVTLAPANHITQAEAASAVFAFYKNVLNYPSDVHVMDWYVTAGYLDFVLNEGLMVGDDKGLFNPYGTVTRAQMVSVLYHHNLPNDGESTDNNVSTPFSDVKAGDWYARAVRWASDEGIVSGYPDGTFLPNKTITRQELAMMAARYAGYKSGATDSNGQICIPSASEEALLKIQGSSEVHPWAWDAMAWCVQNKIISGVMVGNEVLLMPEATANRASLTSIITAVDKLLE